MVANWTTYLFDESVQDFGQAILQRGSWECRKDSVIDGCEYQVWIKPNVESMPDWCRDLSRSVDLADIEANRNSSCVVLICVQGRIFASCFGYGYHLLNSFLFEPGFGVYVAANHVPEEMITQIEVRSWGVEHTVTRTRRSRGGSLESLSKARRNQQLSFLQLGTVEQDGRYGVVRGGTGLQESGIFSLDEMPSRLSRALVKFSKGTSEGSIASYRRPKKLPSTNPFVKESEASLVAMISDSDWYGIQLDLQSEFEVEFRGKRTLLEPAAPQCLGERLGLPANFHIGHLREMYLIPTDQELSVESPKNLFEALIFEVESSIGTCVLLGGSWFLYTHSYLEWLDDEVRRICDRPSLSLPNWQIEWGQEKHYNAGVASEYGWINFDRDPWYGHGNRGRFEICDLLTKDGAFVHVKELDGTPSIGYVMNQAIISATNFRQRDEIKRHVLEAEIREFGIGISSPGRHIVVAIAHDKNDPLVKLLPVGAKIRLVDAVGEMDEMGFQVSVATIRRELIAVA